MINEKHISHIVSQFISIFIQLFKYTQLKPNVPCKRKVSVLQATVYRAESIPNISEEEEEEASKQVSSKKKPTKHTVDCHYRSEFP